MKILRSRVPGHEGACAPTWLNKNTIFYRIDGGITGFFKPVKRGFFGARKFGEEFHGIVQRNSVLTTEIPGKLASMRKNRI